MKLKKGDKVKVMVGKDKGKEVVLERAWENKVIMAGINVFKKHQKKQIVDITKPLPAANVALICPKCKQVTRIGYKLTQKAKVRICRKCEEEI